MKKIIIWLLSAVIFGNSMGYAAPIHEAAWNDKVDEIYQLLREGARINDGDEFGFTPLMYAILNNKPKAFWTLVNLGADIAKRDGDENSVIEYAPRSWIWQIRLHSLSKSVLFTHPDDIKYLDDNNPGSYLKYYHSRDRLPEDILKYLSGTPAETPAEENEVENNAVRNEIISVLKDNEADPWLIEMIQNLPVNILSERDILTSTLESGYWSTYYTYCPVRLEELKNRKVICGKDKSGRYFISYSSDRIYTVFQHDGLKTVNSGKKVWSVIDTSTNYYSMPTDEFDDKALVNYLKKHMKGYYQYMKDYYIK